MDSKSLVQAHNEKLHIYLSIYLVRDSKQLHMMRCFSPVSENLLIARDPILSLYKVEQILGNLVQSGEVLITSHPFISSKDISSS